MGSTPSLRILVQGYYGSQNYGDEAILESLLKLLHAQQYQDISVISSDPPDTLARHGVHAVPGNTLWQVFDAVRKCDVLIHGGGGLIKDMIGRDTAMAIAQFDMLSAKVLRKRSVVFLIGVGEIWTAKGKRYAKRLIPLADLVSVRDQRSASRLLDSDRPTPAQC